MIPMSCPSCGRRGNVPLDRLNTRMHCKKCDAVFHLDATGKPVLGEPAPPKGSKAAKGMRDKNEPLDPIGIVAGYLVKTPKPVWMTGAVLLAGYMLWTVSGWFGSGPASPEQDLTKQVYNATVAFLEKDVSTLRDMTATGTEDAMAKAVDEFRPLIGDGGSSKEGIMIAPGLPFGDDEHKDVDVSLIAMSGPSFTLHFSWVKFKNRWYIDGSTTYTLNQDEAAASAATKKK